jgi:Mg2+ and Co2+ transporter CorA
MSIDRLKAAFDSGIPGCHWIIRFDSTGAAEAGCAEGLKRIDDPGQGFIWLHLDALDRRVVDVLRQIGSLTPEARDVLGGSVNHQYVEHGDHVICGALADHQHGIDGPKEDTDFLRFACGPNYIVTSRRAPIYSAQMTRRALEGGARAGSPIALFELLVARLCQRSADLMKDLANAIDEIEDRVVIDGRGRNQGAELGRVRRSAVRLARQVHGLESTLSRLEEASEDFEHADFSSVAASLGQRAAALVRDVNNLQDRARMLQDEINAILTLETNDRLYVLTVITAVLLPATLVTGYFGMNTKNLPFAESDSGTFYATLICLAAALGALAILWRFGLASAKAEAPRKSDKSSR